MKLGLNFVKSVLEEERANLQLWTSLETQFGTHGICRPISWDYEQERPYKGDTIKDKRRAYLLLFYNPEKAAKDQDMQTGIRTESRQPKEDSRSRQSEGTGPITIQAMEETPESAAMSIKTARS